MTNNFKPMLAATATDRTKLRFPFLASPKLDGIRCVVLNGQVLSRSLKPIRNKFIVERLQNLPDVDGELIVGSATVGDVFNRTTRGVMSAEGTPNFTYHVFDTLQDITAPFHARLAAVPMHPYVMQVPHTTVSTLNALAAYEAQVLSQGYEGVMLRGIDNSYKYALTDNSKHTDIQLVFGDGNTVYFQNSIFEAYVASTRTQTFGGLILTCQLLSNLLLD